MKDRKKRGQGLKKFFSKPLIRGILKEAVSYVPVIGDSISNKIEEKLGTGVVTIDPVSDRRAIIIGRVIVGGLVISLLFGWVDRETFSFIIGEIGEFLN